MEQEKEYQEMMDKIWNNYIDDVDEQYFRNDEKLSVMLGYFMAVERYSKLKKIDVKQLTLNAMKIILDDELKRR